MLARASKQRYVKIEEGGLFHFRTFIQLCNSNFYCYSDNPPRALARLSRMDWITGTRNIATRPPANPLFSVEMTVRSFGNSTMSMFLPFWFFAFRRKNDTVVAELCERKVGSAVASGICRNVPRLRPENSARRTVPGARAG